MGGLVKKLLYVLIGVVALFFVAAIAISLFFDPNDYRDRIAEEVRRETGRELAIEGDLELSVFPWFGIDVGRTTLGNAPGFGDDPFLSFDKARLSVELMPLVRGQGLKVGSGRRSRVCSRINHAIPDEDHQPGHFTPCP